MAADVGGDDRQIAVAGLADRGQNVRRYKAFEIQRGFCGHRERHLLIGALHDLDLEMTGRLARAQLGNATGQDVVGQGG